MNKVLPKKEDVYAAYWTKKKSMKKASEYLGISSGQFHKLIHLYEIPIRNKKEAYNLNKKEWTDEKRNYYSKIHKGKKLSDKTKKKISESQKGNFRNPSKYGGHKKRRSDGYIGIYLPEHKNSSSDGYVMEHVLVMEEFLGRKIKKEEVVHHKDKNRKNNVVTNLELMSFKEHAKMHMTERWENKKEEQKNAQ